MSSSTYPEWSQAQSFQELLVLNREFINKKLDRSPYLCGSLQSESVPFIDGLLRLNKLGLLTTICQSSEPSFDNPAIEEVRQIPYISFIMVENDVCKPEMVARTLRDRSDILFYGFKRYPYIVIEGSHNSTEVVTKYRLANHTAWKDDIRLHLMKPQETEDIYVAFEHIWERNRPWDFTVMGRSYDSDIDIAEIIANAVQAVEK